MIATNGVEEPDVLPTIDLLRTLEVNAIKEFRVSGHPEKIRSQGMAWGSIRAFFLEHLPEDLDDRGQIAYHLVSKAMNEVFGQDQWNTFKPDGRNTTWVQVTPK